MDSVLRSRSASSTGSCAAGSLALPWEVIERVIDYSFDASPTLCSFALTCRQLYPRSILLLFDHIELRSREQLFEFCDLLRTKPHIQSAVRSIAVPPKEFSPNPLLSLLPNLLSVAFSDWRWRGRPADYLTQTSTILYCQRYGRDIRSLTLEGVYISSGMAFFSLFSAFTNLEDLVCGPHLRFGFGIDTNQRAEHRLTRRLRLSKLSVSIGGMHSQLVWILRQLADSASIYRRSLIIWTHRPQNDFSD